jgi:response regulator RpfG family c-di-GMP phosphodiesterase
MSDQFHGPLVEMAISDLIKFADKFSGIELYFPVGGKYRKLNHSVDTFVDILRKLQIKEVNTVFIKEADSHRLVQHINESLSSKSFYDPKTIKEEKFAKVASSMEMVKSIIQKMGAEPHTIRLLKTINERSLVILRESPDIFTLLNDFRKNCSDEYLQALLTNYIMCLVIDKFPWRSEAVKEKTALASLLCDIYLTKDDLLLLKSWKHNGGELPENILQHPLKISESLKDIRDLVSQETITIIEQHHELPDGKGFPSGTSGKRINQLSSIFIVCQQFSEMLYEYAYDYEKRNEIITNIRAIYGSSRTFEKSIEALELVVA